MCIAELRNRGNAKQEAMQRDIFQIDTWLRQRISDRIMYVGHSLGALMQAQSASQYNTDVMGLYGICTYPAFSAIYSDTLLEDLSSLAVKTRIGPFAEMDRLVLPARFAIGDNDQILRTYRKDIMQKFIQEFEKMGAQVRVFNGRNHSFNRDETIAPFNKDEPSILVNNVIEFHKIVQDSTVQQYMG